MLMHLRCQNNSGAMKIRTFFVSHPEKTETSGAVTVEYAIVFPVVIICVMVLVYLGMLCYQQCLMQSAVNEYVQDQAFLWGFAPDGIDMKAGIKSKDAYIDEELYWHIFTDVDKRKKKAVQSLQYELMSKSVIKPHNGFDVEVAYSNFLVYKKIGINAKAMYPLPFKGLFELFGLPGYVLIEAYDETAITDPQEFMQNIDYLLQIYDESGAKDWVKEKCEPLISTLQKIKKYIR